MTRLRFENRLVRELMQRGATPHEARRLAALAQAISRAKVEIDPHYADTVERLLLRDRPGESLAQIIAITRNLDSQVYREQPNARLYALPPTESRRSRARLVVRLSVAAAIVLLVAGGVSRIVHARVSGSSIEAIGPATLDENSPSSGIALPTLSRISAPGGSVRSTATSRAGDTPRRESSSNGGPTSRSASNSGQGCSVVGNKESGAGIVPVPSVHCHGVG
jgi:hypothetical protein